MKVKFKNAESFPEMATVLSYVSQYKAEQSERFGKKRGRIRTTSAYYRGDGMLIEVYVNLFGTYVANIRQRGQVKSVKKNVDNLKLLNAE